MKKIIVLTIVYFWTSTIYAQIYTDSPTNILVPITGFQVPKPYNGKKGQARISIAYGSGHTSLQKPFIVAEGYDPWRILNAEQANHLVKKTINFPFPHTIYVGAPFPEEQVYDSAKSNFRYETFTRRLDYGNIIEPILFNGHSFEQDLYLSGYDLVFVDWRDGTDYIQRNAYVLENIIQWANTEKAKNGSTEKNIVMGMSMGGLCARYALADMEKSGINHDTKLYISHDTPHQGANVPLGYQAMIIDLDDHFKILGKTIGDMSPDIRNGHNLLKTTCVTTNAYCPIL